MNLVNWVARFLRDNNAPNCRHINAAITQLTRASPRSVLEQRGDQAIRRRYKRRRSPKRQ